MTTKTQLREKISKKRNTLNLQWVESTSVQIEKNLQSLETFQTAETIALYMAIGGEVKLDALFSRCWELGKRTCIPIFNRTLQRYEMAEITDETHFKIGAYGIKEPLSPTLVSTDWIDLMVVPGVAFDLQGNRLGRGGGYYDRLMDGFSGKTAALAFDFQIFTEIPVDPHDQPVNFIITQTKMVKV